MLYLHSFPPYYPPPLPFLFTLLTFSDSLPFNLLLLSFISLAIFPFPSSPPYYLPLFLYIPFFTPSHSYLIYLSLVFLLFASLLHLLPFLFTHLSLSSILFTVLTPYLPSLFTFLSPSLTLLTPYLPYLPISLPLLPFLLPIFLIYQSPSLPLSLPFSHPISLSYLPFSPLLFLLFTLKVPPVSTVYILH